MAVAIDPNVPSVYNLKRDRELPESERTRFLIRPMLFSDCIKFQKMQESGKLERNPNVLFEIINKFLFGWENYKNGDGDLVEFVRLSKEEMEDPEKMFTNLDKLSMPDTMELFEEIGRQMLVPIEGHTAKNSY